jgi:MYXO-CTERM domain-containing protein
MLRPMRTLPLLSVSLPLLLAVSSALAAPSMLLPPARSGPSALSSRSAPSASQAAVGARALRGSSPAQASPVVATGRFPEVAGRAAVVPRGATARAAEQAARALLQGLLPAAASAELGAASELRMASGERVVKMAQVHGGLPVAMRGASVVFGADGVARQLAAHLEPAGDLPGSAAPALTAEQAARAASGAAGITMSPAQMRLGVWPGAAGARLAWVGQGIPIAALPFAPVVVLDAQTGELMVRFDAARAKNKAKVYATNPIKSPDLIDVDVNPSDGSTVLKNELVESHNCIDEKKVVNVMGFLDAHTCTLKQTAVADVDGDFMAYAPPAADTDPEDAFSELSIFYHVNRAYEMFRGYSPTLSVQKGPIAAVSNLRIPQGYQTLDTMKLGDPDLPLEPFQNAFFAPENPLFAAIFGLSGGAMWFGQGPKRDYSYDGDVVYHEFTHAVINATIQLVGTPHADAYGVTVSPGGMNEGLADYFSSALAGDPDVGEYASTDFAPGSSAIRSLTAADTCPASIGGEVHQDATLFSGALWDTRATLAEADAKAFDLALFTAMAASPSGDLGYEDLAQLFVEGVKASPLGEPAATALEAAFTARGVLPGCTRIFEYEGKPLDGPGALIGNWIVPGTTTSGLSKPLGYSPGIVQAHAALPAGAAKLVVTLKKGTISAGGGGGSIFGSQGTPYAPEVLVRFGEEPVQFSYKPYKVAEGVIQVTPTLDKNTYTAEFDVPEGATSAYAMVANSGQQDGTFTHLDITTTAAPGGEGGAAGAAGAAGEGGAAAEGGSAGAGGSGEGGSAAGTGAAGGAAGAAGAAGAGVASGNPAAEGVGDEDSSGCGCAVPGGRTGVGGGVVGLLLLGLGLVRRRRPA